MVAGEAANCLPFWQVGSFRTDARRGRGRFRWMRAQRGRCVGRWRRL